MNLEREGGCLCGAVRFQAVLTGTNFGVCHCPMCRKWTGSALLGITVPDANVAWTGLEHVAKRQSSPWGERAWCADCGSALWFRVTVDGPYAGNVELPIGTFDDANGLHRPQARQLCLRGRGSERFDASAVRGEIPASGQ